jgi:hypothetical protein
MLGGGVFNSKNQLVGIHKGCVKSKRGRFSAFTDIKFAIELINSYNE